MSELLCKLCGGKHTDGLCEETLKEFFKEFGKIESLADMERAVHSIIVDKEKARVIIEEVRGLYFVTQEGVSSNELMEGRPQAEIASNTEDAIRKFFKELPQAIDELIGYHQKAVLENPHL